MHKLTETHFFKAYVLNGLIIAVIAVCTLEFNYLLRHKFKVNNLGLIILYTFLFSILIAMLVYIIIALIIGKGDIMSRLSNPVTLNP